MCFISFHRNKMVILVASSRRQENLMVTFHKETIACILAISVTKFKQLDCFCEITKLSNTQEVMADDENNGLVLKLIICLIAAASAAVIVTVYHCVTARYMRPPPSRRWLLPPEVQQHHHQQQQEMSVSLENSVAELLPARKYRKDVGLVGVDDATCAICLCEFEEGEELRSLPECSHSFHVACIDMWLCSHWSCPMCRSAIGVLGSSSPTLMHLLNPSSNMRNTSPIETL